MTGLWTVTVPEAGTNLVLNPSAELAGNFSPFGTPSTSASASPSGSQSGSPSASASPSASLSPSASGSLSSSASVSGSPSASASPSASVSGSPPGSASPSASASASPAEAGVTRITSNARFGNYSYNIVPTDTLQGIGLTLSALAGAIHYMTFYSGSGGAGTLQISLDNGANFNDVTLLNSSGTWHRYGVQIPAAQASGSTQLIIRSLATSSFVIDGVMVQALSYATTYIDGDQGPNYRWTGLRHGSSSTRDAQERGGGRERNFDDYGIEVVEGTARFGLPPVIHNLQPTPLSPGAAYQSAKILPRELSLVFLLPEGSSGLTGLHTLRKDLIDVLRGDLVRGNQPLVIGYRGAQSNRTVYGSFRYAGGLEFDGQFGFNEQPKVRLLATDPYWYEDDRETATVDFTDSVTAAYNMARINGDWQALGTGFNDEAWCIAYDAERGRVYYGGEFTTANGVVVNGVCFWNGSTFVAMDGGVGAGAGTLRVRTIAIAPNGDVWVGGDFLTVGSAAAATKGLARWNIATGTWTAFNESTTAFSAIYAVAIDAGGNVFIGGSFTDWEGDANSDYIASTSDNGTNWDALGSGMDALILAMVIGADGNVYIGGLFSTGNGVTLNGVGYWNGTQFIAMGSVPGVSGGNGDVYALVIRPDGNVYASGDFTTAGGVAASNIAMWNGTFWEALGSGASGGIVGTMALASDDLLYVGGDFSSIGGLTTAIRLAAWNGYTWIALDTFATDTVRALLAAGRDIYLGLKGSGTLTAAGQTTITTTATTDVFPEVTIIGPSSSTATLQWIENQTTQEALYFDLVINTLETIGMNFQPGNKTVGSLWGARPSQTVPAVFVPGRFTGPFPPAYVRFGFTYIVNRITGQPLRGSDFASFHLQAGANTIAAFVSGTTTGMVMLMHWVPRHLAVDGAAA